MAPDPAGFGSLPVVPLASEWVLPNGFGSNDLAMPHLAVFPSNVGFAEVGFRPLGEGAFLLDTRSQFHVPVTVGARVLLDEPILAVRLPSSGRSLVRHPGNPSLEESAEFYNISLVSDAACQVDNQPGETQLSLTSVFTAGSLRSLLDGHSIPRPLRLFLDGRLDNFGAAVRTSAKLHRVAAQIRAQPYAGLMASLYVRGKMYELMAEVLADLTDIREKAARSLHSDQCRALAARDILIDNLGAPPAIEDLARLVGLSQRRLNQLFRDLFGATVFACLVRWRLDHAKSLLARGDLSVKQVAHLMGYAHVSNFTFAFFRRFGMPPAHWRREQSGREQLEGLREWK
ncbi:MAG: helix-turn-helix transcriptional regulator [Magnetospirillum sp.]|nr:helix-turn-helix transcriptional regulator [Magnetospirillum sp.]